MASYAGYTLGLSQTRHFTFYSVDWNLEFFIYLADIIFKPKSNMLTTL